MMHQSASLLVALALVPIVSVMAVPQRQAETLVVSGHAGSVPVIRINGQSYVEVESLARLADGSLKFTGNQIALTLLATTANEKPVAASADVAAANAGLSKQFLQTGIEEMSTIREWHSVLASAIENQYPITEGGLRPYQADSMTSLRLIQAAATTDSDKMAAQLITGVYQKMEQLSDKYLKTRANMTYIAPDTLKNDPLNVSIVACGKALGVMAASAQFVDIPACH
jgi:hypothetical protein